MILIKEFVNKYFSGKLSDEIMELVTGGNVDDACRVLREACKAIPATQIREECDVTYRDLCGGGYPD